VSIAQRPSRRAGAPDPSRAERADVADDSGTATDGGLRPELIVLVVVALAIGVVLRFVSRSPLWLDEALSVNIAGLPLGEIPDALRHDGHPPLYYVLLHGWSQVFGTSDVAVRALSGVLSVFMLPLVWLASRRRGGPRLAVIALSLFALAPFALRYATETRMYTLVMVLVLAGYLLIDDVVRRGRATLVRLVGIALVSTALLYAHYWSLWLLGALVIVLGWRSWRSPDVGTRSAAMKAIAAIVVGGLLFVPWLPVMLYQSSHTATPWAGPQRPTSIFAVTLADFGGGGFRDAEFTGTVLALLFLLGLFGRALSADRIELELRTVRQYRYEATVVGLTVALGALVSYATSSAYASRYAAVVFPLFTLVAAAGISRFVGRWVQFALLTAVLAMCLMGGIFVATSQRTQAGVIADEVAAKARPGDVVVYCPDQLGPAGAREMPAGLDQVVFPSLARPERMDWVDYLERVQNTDPTAFATQVAERAGPSRGIFLVWNGEYRGLEGRCEAVLDGLLATRSGGQYLAPDGRDEYFEHAQVVWFPPAA
jgi:hypothetical protein